MMNWKKGETIPHYSEVLFYDVRFPDVFHIGVGSDLGFESNETDFDGDALMFPAEAVMYILLTELKTPHNTKQP